MWAKKRPPAYSELDSMTKRPKKTTQVADSCLSTFDDTILFTEISAITYRGKRSNQYRHDCLVRMAYFMTLSACMQLCSCLDPNLVFVFDDVLKATVQYKTAVSTMYLLAELLTVPNYSTQFKLKNVEKTALEACASLCKIRQEHARAL